MKVIAKEPGFYGGYRRKVGDSFEFLGKTPAKWMVPEGTQVKVKAEPESDKEMTAAEIKNQLTLAGVEFKGNASKADLLELLNETIKKAAPAGSGAPDKSTLL